MPRATPNITNAKMIFTNVISPEPRFGSSGSISNKYSFIYSILASYTK